MIFNIEFVFAGKRAPIRKNVVADAWFPAVTIAAIDIEGTPAVIIVRPQPPRGEAAPRRDTCPACGTMEDDGK